LQLLPQSPQPPLPLSPPLVPPQVLPLHQLLPPPPLVPPQVIPLLHQLLPLPLPLLLPPLLKD